jgi:hypothetical protein
VKKNKILEEFAPLYDKLFYFPGDKENRFDGYQNNLGDRLNVKGRESSGASLHFKVP